MSELKKLPRVLAIHDISCYGKCSLTVALPVISACGIEVAPLPTAVLSTNTSFENFVFEDFTEPMGKVTSHWKDINLKFDAVYSGFLGSVEQIDSIKNIINEFEISNVIVDPVMGDKGVIYKTYTKDMCENMKTLVAVSDITMPNLTEACILTDEDYNAADTSSEGIRKMTQKISDLGTKNVVIKGIERGSKLYNCILSDGEYIEREVDLLPFRMHGTGDLFSSVFAGTYMSGKTLIESVDKAADFVIDVMKYSKETEEFGRRGPCFEPFLHKLI